MPDVIMPKSGGGSRYSTADLRFDSKTTCTLFDRNTGDRLVFPTSDVVDKKDKTPIAQLIGAGRARWVVNPARGDRPERRTLVYSGKVSYSASARGDVLYQIGPADNVHLVRFVGLVRANTNKLPSIALVMQRPNWEDEWTSKLAAEPVVPGWDTQRAFEEGGEARQVFGAEFVTDADDEMPFLEVRWNYWPYNKRIIVGENPNDDEPMMIVTQMPDRAGEAMRALYELLNVAQVIGKNERGEPIMRTVISGASENYLPPLETILIQRLLRERFTLVCEEKKNKKDKLAVSYSRLQRMIQAAAPKPKTAKRK